MEAIVRENQEADLHWDCESCGSVGAHLYEQTSFDPEPQIQIRRICVRCARTERKTGAEPNPQGLGRRELINELDRFFKTSGVFEICGRCHRQGTGCCPTSCRVMGPAGCDSENRYGKTVFCAAFLCSALLNAVSEIDADIGRELRRIKREYGPAEFHLYEMITRTPSESREPGRPLRLPERYPSPAGLDGDGIRDRLLALSDEILEIRRRWRDIEINETMKGEQTK